MRLTIFLGRLWLQYSCSGKRISHFPAVFMRKPTQIISKLRLRVHKSARLQIHEPFASFYAKMFAPYEQNKSNTTRLQNSFFTAFTVVVLCCHVSPFSTLIGRYSQAGGVVLQYCTCHLLYQLHVYGCRCSYTAVITLLEVDKLSYFKYKQCFRPIFYAKTMNIITHNIMMSLLRHYINTLFGKQVN